MTGSSEGLVRGGLEFLLNYALHSTILLGMAWLLGRLLLRREAWREIAWKTALVGSVVTTAVSQMPGREWALRMHAPIIAPPGSEMVLVAPAVATAAQPIVTGFEELAGEPRTQAVTAPEGPAITRLGVPDVLAWLRGISVAARSTGPTGILVAWGLIALLMLGRLARRHRHLYRALAERRPVVEGPATQILADLRCSSGYRRPVRLTSTDAVPTPLALSRSEICLPAQFFRRLGAEEQKVALAHEFAHLVRRDPSWHVGAQVLGAMFFFQPLHRVASRKLRESSELLADAWAVRETGSRLGLVRCLAEVGHWIRSAHPVHSAGSVAMAEAGSPLMTRVRRLLDGEIETVASPRAARLGAAIAVVTAAALAPEVVSRPPALAAPVLTGGPGLEVQSEIARPAEVPAAPVPAPTIAAPAASPEELAPTTAPESFVAAAAEMLDEPTQPLAPSLDVTAVEIPSPSLEVELGNALRDLEPASLLVAPAVQPTAIVEAPTPAIQLDEIVITGQRITRSERLERVGFYRRRDAGFGRFFDARDINELGVQDLSGFFFTTPGLPRRCSGVRCGQNDSGRGFAGFSNPDGCEYQFFVDGVLGVGPGGLGGDLGYVEAIEIYSGPSQLPPQFHGWGGACGAVVVWTHF